MGKVIWDDSGLAEAGIIIQEGPPDALPVRHCEDPFLKLVYRADEANSWLSRRRIIRRKFTKHNDIISRVQSLKYPRWMDETCSPTWDQVKAMCTSVGQQMVFSNAYMIALEAREGEKAANEEENLRLTLLINDAIDFTASIGEHADSNIDPDFRTNGWPDACNACFSSLAFGQLEGSLPQEVAIGYNIPWKVHPPGGSVQTEASDPSHLIVDSVFSISIPVSGVLDEFARQVSLEKSSFPEVSDSPVITVPWLIVEYVKFSEGSSVARSVHETHLAAAFEVALRMYQSLGLDMPVFGILVDRLEVQVFAAAACKMDSDVDDDPTDDPTFIQYYQVSESYVDLVIGAYDLCQILDGIMRYSNFFCRELKERLLRLEDGAHTVG